MAGQDDIRALMPVLARHEGEWHGTYRYVDEDGAIVDEHEAQLTCSFPDGGGYAQVNRYTWADGRHEEHDFPATLEVPEDGPPRIVFDTERIRGHAWEIDDRTVVLTWSYKSDPSNYLYEMIQLSADGRHRARTWHWFEEDRIAKRTLIRETRLDA